MLKDVNINWTVNSAILSFALERFVAACMKTKPLPRTDVPCCRWRLAAAPARGAFPACHLWNSLSATFTHTYRVWHHLAPSPTSTPALSHKVIWVISAQLNMHRLRAGDCCGRLTPLSPEHCAPVGTATCSISAVGICSATRLAEGYILEPRHRANKMRFLQPPASIHSFSHFCLSAGQAANCASRTATSPSPWTPALATSACSTLLPSFQCQPHHAGWLWHIQHWPIPFPSLGV